MVVPSSETGITELFGNVDFGGFKLLVRPMSFQDSLIHFSYRRRTPKFIGPVQISLLYSQPAYPMELWLHDNQAQNLVA